MGRIRRDQPGDDRGLPHDAPSLEGKFWLDGFDLESTPNSVGLRGQLRKEMSRLREELQRQG